MMRFLIGVLIGLVVATVGLSGLANMADKAISETQTHIKALADKE